MNDLDRLLGENDALVPSAGFTTRVMEAVVEATTEPPPLPFPWARFGLLVLACAVWAASAAWLPSVPALSDFWPLRDGLDATTRQLQNVSVAGALILATVVVTARWRRERAPMP